VQIVGPQFGDLTTIAAAKFLEQEFQPFVAPKTDRHLLTVGRAVIAVIMAGGIGAALFVGNLLDLSMLRPRPPSSALDQLGFTWRRLTSGDLHQAAICLRSAIIPNVFQTEWYLLRPSGRDSPGWYDRGRGAQRRRRRGPGRVGREDRETVPSGPRASFKSGPGRPQDPASPGWDQALKPRSGS
jgi:hypothetical protein